MAFTGQLGTSLSTLGANLEVGGPAFPVDYPAGVLEAVTLSEGSAVLAGFSGVLAETLTLADAVGGVQSQHIPGSEAVLLSEALSPTRDLGVQVSATVTHTEAVTATPGARPSGQDTLTLTEGLTISNGSELLEALSLSEALAFQQSDFAPVSEALTQTADVAAGVGAVEQIAEQVSLFESVQASGFVIVSLDGYTIQAQFPVELRLDGVLDPANYELIPLDGGVPISITGVQPNFRVKTPSVTANAIPTTGQLFDSGIQSDLLESATTEFDPSSFGDYLDVTSPSGLNNSSNLRIEQVVDGTHVEVDRPLLVNSSLQDPLTLVHKSAVIGVTLATSKSTRGKSYLFVVKGLREKQAGALFTTSTVFTAVSEKPQLKSVLFQPDGSVVVTFDQAMRHDSFLTSPDEYTITGATTVVVERVLSAAEDQVVLNTSGMGDGGYTLSVNALGTPHDLAGNPIDPFFNQAVFTGASPLLQRSIFTDKGPIAKPPLSLQAGVNVTIQTYTSPIFGTGTPFTSTHVRLTGGAFVANHVGLYITISGTQLNDGTYRIAGLVGAGPTNTLNLQAIFRLPDANNGLNSTSWLLFDPRNGQIADDPSDVVVKVNGLPTPATSVVGLLGQVILPSVPDPTDTVTVDYAWVCNPVVDFRRLNSREFTLNNWDYDVGHFPNPSQHTYRYRNTLVETDSYGGANILATLDQPLLRSVHYRAYERAYSALLNDPALLLLNTPFHRIAYPPLERIVTGDSVSYSPFTLPESDPTAPWDRKGSGIASVALEQLTVTDNTTGPFPSGNPLFWFRSTDLSFPHVFAATWRMVVTEVVSKEGIWTGVSVGWSNGQRAIVLGYLDDGVSKKVGFLKRGSGNNPGATASWIGGLDVLNSPTHAPVAFDWSIVHSYRFFRSEDGVVKLYVDGGVMPLLQASESELIFLEELDDPFTKLEGAFFGSLSLPAESTSVWDFMRYVVLPVNPEQNAPSIFVNYEANDIPEDSPPLWTPVGYHGVETIIGGNTLLVDSFSATDQATEALVGLVDGDFRGYTRIEPLLAKSSDVALDVKMQVLSYTHGISPNGAMVAIDDGDRLVQLSFLSSVAQPKASYGGRSFPTDSTPAAWSVLGSGATATMVGRTLNITDTSNSDGLVYFMEDLVAVDSSNRIVSSAIDYVMEFRVRVNSYTASPDSFAGASGDVFDGLRDVGLALSDEAGIKKIGFHSDGAFIQKYAFGWGDGNFHTYRVVKSSSPGTAIFNGFNGIAGGTTFQDLSTDFFVDGVLPGDELVISSGGSTGVYPITGINSPTTLQLSVFVPIPGSNVVYQVQRNRNHTVALFADAVFVGSLDYNQFAAPAPGAPATMTFGSSTPATAQSVSDVDWVYFNVFRRPDESVQKFVGIWKGTDPNSFAGYYLPLKEDGIAFVGVSGTMVTDSAADFLTAGVQVGDPLIVDDGPNKGDYTVTGVASSTQLLITPAFPLAPTQVRYRIPSQVDFTALHAYRLVKDPGGAVALFLDSVTDPIIRVAYSETTLPPSSAGLPSAVQNGFPSISFGAFDPTNLSQTNWDYVRYGITRSITELRIVPPHQVLNQRNVMSSPEHLTGTVAHNHTQYSSASTGVPYPWESYVNNPLTGAFTKLNDGTPIVPLTQTYEVRRPTPVFVPVASLNNPADVLNSPGSFTLNNGTIKVTLLVPNDVLYNSLEIVEQATGEEDLLAPIFDQCQPYSLGSLYFQKETCLVYDGTVLPENDSTPPTPWTLVSEVPGNVSTTTAAGVLTYSVNGGGGQTVYRNNTPLPDSIGLDTEVSFRVKLLNDSTSGMGDTGVRFGFSAFGLTAALAFITTPLGDRQVHVLDLLANVTLGSIPFDFLDGNFHTYRLVKNVEAGAIDFLIEP